MAADRFGLIYDGRSLDIARRYSEGKIMEDIEKKKLIKQLHHIWNSGEVEAIPEVYSTKIIVHWPKGFAVN